MGKRYPVPGQKSRFEGEKSSAIKNLFSDEELKYSWEVEEPDSISDINSNCTCNPTEESDDIHQPKKRGCCKSKQIDGGSCGCGESCKCK